MVGRQHAHGSRGIWNKGVNPNRKPSVSSGMELDCHLTQKPKRDAARSNPGGQPKKTSPRASKAERESENVARRRSRKASKHVIVEKRSRKKSRERSAVSNPKGLTQSGGDAEQIAAKRVQAIRADIETTKGRLTALNAQLRLAMEKLKAAQVLSHTVKERSQGRKRRSLRSEK